MSEEFGDYMQTKCMLLVYCVLNVLINTKEKLGLQIDLCVFLNNDVFFICKVGNVFDDTLSRYIMCLER